MVWLNSASRILSRRLSNGTAAVPHLFVGGLMWINTELSLSPFPHFIQEPMIGFGRYSKKGSHNVYSRNRCRTPHFYFISSFIIQWIVGTRV